MTHHIAEAICFCLQLSKKAEPVIPGTSETAVPYDHTAQCPHCHSVTGGRVKSSNSHVGGGIYDAPHSRSYMFLSAAFNKS